MRWVEVWVRSDMERTDMKGGRVGRRLGGEGRVGKQREGTNKNKARWEEGRGEGEDEENIRGGLMREVGGESRAEGGPEDMGGVRDG